MSDWGSYLISEIEGAEVPQGKVSFWFIGGSGFVLKTGQIVYIDPYFGGSDPSHDPPIVRMIPVPFEPSLIKKADIVLCTHQHMDHCHRGSLLPIYLNTRATFVGPEPVFQKLLGWGFEKSRVRLVKKGDTLHSEDIEIQVTESNDPQVEEAVTYLLQAPGATFFHSGDSHYFEGFLRIGNKLSIDFAFINFGRNPPGRSYYMTPCDFLRTARDLRARKTIPMHWDMWKFSYQDPIILERFKKLWCPESEILIMRIGDKYVWPQDRS